jgi:histidine kinase
MTWLRHLRWKLFVSHLLIIVIGVIVLIATANFLAGTNLIVEQSFSLGAAASETGQVTTPIQAPAPAQQRRFQMVVDQALLIAGFAALAAAIVVSLFVSRRIVEPLQELSMVSRRLALGYYQERTSIQSDDELAVLSQSINQLAEALEQTEQRRLALLADVAHELRTPLTTIEGYMEGLIDGVIAPEPQTFSVIQHEAVRLKRLIRELALLSHAEAGQLPVAPRPIELWTVVERVVASFQLQFAAQDVRLEQNIALDLPHALADPDRLEQVLINLLSNALRYTPAGGSVLIAAEPHDFFIQLSIRDTGVGIAKDHLPHVFERFYRVDKSRTRESGGTGIGLTIARHLVYAQGGEIWAESPGLGKGTIFYITLPVSAAVPSIA